MLRQQTKRRGEEATEQQQQPEERYCTVTNRYNKSLNLKFRVLSRVLMFD